MLDSRTSATVVGVSNVRLYHVKCHSEINVVASSLPRHLSFSIHTVKIIFENYLPHTL